LSGGGVGGCVYRSLQLYIWTLYMVVESIKKFLAQYLKYLAPVATPGTLPGSYLGKIAGAKHLRTLKIAGAKHRNN
jgi:hypothetical protein